MKTNHMANPATTPATIAGGMMYVLKKSEILQKPAKGSTTQRNLTT